ncbi:MAG: CehA/McbA family metallohydrolase [Myxococcaceae bacterium]|nr:CehA/McbA family metallohydrolase [Myxococcaceae bacterium]
MRLIALLFLLPATVVAQPLVLEGELPTTGPDFVLVPFEVPPGTAEVEVRHPVQQPENILDYGLADARGFRGWGGGNDEPFIVNERAASRSYLPGPLTPGTWHVVIGKAKVVTAPARYRLEIERRPSATLAPQAGRASTPWTPGAPLERGARWYAGDLHVHSRESGDAAPTLDAIATFARGRGLDFVHLSEHNTTSQLAFFADVQSRHPALLLLPGMEFTTYGGHANAIGATAPIDHRFGVEGATFDAAVAAMEAQGALLSINHPVLDLGQLCIGCAWRQRVAASKVRAVEIGTGGWDKTGAIFGQQAIAFWDRQLDQGSRAAPVGGSDDHSGGRATGSFDSPIGNPTTMVFAQELSVPAVLEGLRAGRTVVKLQGPSDPMVALRLGDAGIGDEVALGTGSLEATVTGGRGQVLAWLENGRVVEEQPIDADPFTASRAVQGPTSGVTRWRAEVRLSGAPRTVTGHVWLRAMEHEPASCGCTASAPALWGLGAGLLLLLRSARRRTAPPRRSDFAGPRA